jgi:hypothetical protein
VYSREFKRCNSSQHSIPAYPIDHVRGAGAYLDGKMLVCGGDHYPWSFDTLCKCLEKKSLSEKINNP